MKHRIDRSKIAGRWAAALLMTTGLTPLVLTVGAASAWAQGGSGGNLNVSGGGAGGADSTTGTGATGGNSTNSRAGGGGGGGGTASGGGGGTAIGISGGTGGAAGAGAGGSGGAGGDGGNSGGGGGGGGGVAGLFSAGSTTTTTGLTGGAGGAGGTGNATGVGSGSGGGGGGGAGYGAIVSSGTYTITAAGSATGGTGGAGGVTNAGGASPTVAIAGNGGSGGIGVSLGSGATLNNAGTVTGGTGGAGGTIINGTGTAGAAGAGGAGVVGSGITIVNSGTITGGSAGGGGAQANAITFTGGTNVLELRAGSIINGNVQAATTADTLRLGGTTNSSLDVSQIGSAAQYRGFGVVEKTGSSTWTLTGTTGAATPWTITAGTLALSSGADISSSSLVTANGTLDISGNGGTTAINALSGSGMVQLGGNGLVIGNASTEFSGAINGSGGLRIASGTQTLSGINGYTNATQIDQGATLALKGNGSIASSATVTFAPAGAGTASLDISQTNSGTAVAALFDILGVGAINLGSKTLTIADGGTFNGVIADGGIGGGAGGGLTVAGNELDLGGVNTYTGATTIMAGATLALLSPGSIATSSGVNLAGAGASFDISGSGTGQTIKDLAGIAGSTVSLGSFGLTVGTANSTTFAGVIADGGLFGGVGGSLIKQGSGTLTLSGANTYTGGTTVNAGMINFAALNNFGTGMITLNGGGLQWAAGTTTDISSRLAPLGASGGTLDTNGNNVTLASAISGTGALTKQGQGTLTLTAANNYSGGTIVTGGLINFSAANNFGTGMITLAGGGLQWAAGSTADISSKLAPLGAGGATFDTNGSNVTFATGLTGVGGITKQGNGILNLAGTNTFTGPTAINGGTLAVNGSLTSNVTVGSGGTLGGNGTITGLVTNNGTLAPGNSIGTITVNGSFVQSAGSIYQVEVNAAGQGDRINVSGAPGTATINGGTVQVLAQAGNYANSTTYTIVRATGGVSGVYSGVTSNFAFLTPTLSYDANDVFLTLALGQTAFTPSFLALTPNQKAVGVALNQSFAGATGDFATVIGVLAGLNTTQGPLALNTISGEPWADFGTMNTNNSAMFMNALGQQMAMARGAASTGQRQALAQACDIAACDGASSPLSAWVSALGGLGSVLGDSNASTLTYNFGGAAAGLDYRLDPRFLVGIGAGYTHGTQWVNSFLGQGWSDSVSVAAYGSFTQSGFYVDALAGYAYFNNQLQRQILIPGLQQRTASGSTGANQFLGQAEGGYKIDVYAPAAATVTPFGRLQVSSVTQNAFSESGAQSLSLNVAQQTTNSLRTTLGADLASSIGLGNEKTLDLALRLGWMHEFADTGRPITAAFAGAPANSFTAFGATPLRNSAVIGLSASTNIAAATSLYLRYDGEIAAGTDNHALTAGLRMSW